MKLRSTTALRRAIVLVSGAFLLSCRESPTAPRPLTPADAIARDLAPGEPQILISQIYGGGGNTGATYKNDFVELFNPGNAPVDLSGWSVQYASSAGTTWQVTNIAGTIPAGGYYLVQESAGTGGTVSLPTPDATGTIAMSATAGKIALVSSTTALSGACPASTGYVDLVAFGSGTACGTFAPAPSNTVGDLRSNAGCTWTGSPSADFTAVAPTPRNSASGVGICGAIGPQPASATVAPDNISIPAGTTTTFVATAKDGGGNAVGTTFTWASSNTAAATIDASGVATGVAAGTTTITATTPNSIVATATLTVTAVANVAGSIVISQVYGGGGNAGAPLTNDFIELFNRSTQAVNIAGWSVQYSSAAGTFTAATPLTGTIPSGGYYLVQESAGAANPAPLPTPDATGSLALSATSGKVILVQTASPLGTSCPTGPIVVDEVSYGSVSPACGTATAVLSNTTAALRNSGGCAYTPDAAVDFTVGAPAPRNSATAARSCVAGPLDHVAITGNLSVVAGATTQLAGTALDAVGNTVPGATIAWTTSDATIATVDQAGKVSGVLASGNPVTITATATSGAIIKTASVQVQVNGNGINWIDVSSSATSFPPGFQTQLFATARLTQGGAIIPATFTFEAVDPSIATVATVQGTGIITGVSAPLDGTKPGIKITATPTGGGAPYVFISHPVTIEIGHPAPTSIYAINDDFGDPTPAGTNPLDFLIRRPQYTISYNQSRGTPNWVSYELDSRQMVAGQDRCNCFTADPLLPSANQIFTSDYTNGGFDRGHMTRSADRTAGNVDNAISFYLTNVVPQAADLNEGVWAQFEDALADSANAGRAVYIITGPLFSRSHGLSFLKGEGKVAIPDSTWKVALIGPGNNGNPFNHTNVQGWDQITGLSIMAVNMPNVAGVRNDPWQKYLTTVESIETATGYSFLSAVPTGMRAAIFYHDHAPVAQFSTSGTLAEGSSVTFDASASTDPDLGRPDLGRTEALNYSWHFSDGGDAVGKVVTHTFANDGNYTAALTVTDAFGWPNVISSPVTVANVAPVPSFVLATGPLLPGETLTGSGSFTDPGADTWNATVDFGDGSGAGALSLAGMGFSLSHAYGVAGTFTVTVSVTDEHVAGSSTSSITVMTQAAGLDSTTALVNRLQSTGSILRITALAFDATLDAAKREVQKGHSTAAIVLLRGLNAEIDLTVKLGRMTAPDAATMKMLVNRIVDSLDGP